MKLPIVTETSALSAHRREVDLVRWSLMAVPEAGAARGATDVRDPLRRIDHAAVVRVTEIAVEARAD